MQLGPISTSTLEVVIETSLVSLFCIAQFQDLFWNGLHDFFHTHVNATPLCTTFWNGPKWNGMISYPCEQGLGHGHMTILINTEINTEEEAHESVLNLIN